jgi:hypothetical protein
MEYDKELVKKKTKEIMGICFKNFKGTRYKHFVLQNKEPDFDGGQFSKQKDFWQDFKEYRSSEEYLELSRKKRRTHRKRQILIISALVATPKRCQSLQQNLIRWITLLRKAFRLRPTIGSQDQ